MNWRKVGASGASLVACHSSPLYDNLAVSVEENWLMELQGQDGVLSESLSSEGYKSTT